MKQGVVLVGHPVDVGSGAQYTAAHDVEVMGAFPMVFRRTYSTTLLGDPPGALGRGWVHNLDAQLLRDLDGYRFHGHDGAVVTFDDPDGTVEAGGLLRNVGDAMELRRDGDRYIVAHWHDLDVPVIRYVFEAASHERMWMVAIDEPAGQGIDLRRDASGRIALAVEREHGCSLGFTYNAAGRLASLTLVAPWTEPRVVATYGYDARGMLAEVRDGAGLPMRYGYDADARLVEETGRNGGAWRMGYDLAGRCARVEGDGGRSARRFRYYDGGRMVEVVDGLGRTTLYECNERGQVEQEIRPNGARLVARFDALGRVIGVTNPLGEAIGYEYDDRGNLTRTTWANGATREVLWNDDHQPIAIRNPDGGEWRMRYERGALVETTDPSGGVRRSSFDARGRLVAHQSVRRNVSEISRGDDGAWWIARDALGVSYAERRGPWLTPERWQDQMGLVAVATRDANGRVTFEADATGATWSYTRDAEGNIVRVRSPDGAVRTVEWSPFGDRVAEVDPAGARWSFERDLEGRTRAIHGPRGVVARFEYDLADNVASITYADGAEERFEYDLANRPTRHVRQDGATLDIEHHPLGDVSRVSCDGVELLRQTFDLAGQPVEVVTPDATVTITYDLMGEVVAETTNGRSIRCARDEGGAIRERVVDGARSGVLRFEYDPRGRLQALHDGDGLAQRLAYDLRDRAARRSMGAAEERWDYDPADRVARQVVGGIVERTFARTAEGLVARVEDSLRGELAIERDEMGRLTATTRDGAEAQYRWDSHGNVRGVGGREVEHDACDRPVRVGDTTLRYDACGRMVEREAGGAVTRFRWDALDRMCAVEHPDGAVTRYCYDGFGRRVARESGGRRTDFLWLGDDLVGEHDDERVVDYASSEGVATAVWIDGERLHVIAGLNDRPSELLDADGELAWWGSYDDWGALLAGSGAREGLRLRLPGQQYDAETGLHYNRFRYYDPSSGSYVSPDPLRYGAGFNLHRYAPDPYTWSDVLGLVCGKGTGKYSVYVLERREKNPATGKLEMRVVYVGITGQTPRSRMLQHRADGKNFYQMRVVDNNLCYRGARDLEGSALRHQYTGGLNDVHSGGLTNASRGDGYHFHSYGNPPGGARTLIPASTTNAQLSNNLGVER